MKFLTKSFLAVMTLTCVISASASSQTFAEKNLAFIQSQLGVVSKNLKYLSGKWNALEATLYSKSNEWDKLCLQLNYASMQRSIIMNKVVYNNEQYINRSNALIQNDIALFQIKTSLNQLHFERPYILNERMIIQNEIFKCQSILSALSTEQIKLKLNLERVVEEKSISESENNLKQMKEKTAETAKLLVSIKKAEDDLSYLTSKIEKTMSDFESVFDKQKDKYKELI